MRTCLHTAGKLAFKNLLYTHWWVVLTKPLSRRFQHGEFKYCAHDKWHHQNWRTLETGLTTRTTASFLSRFYQRPLGNPWSVNLIWNTVPGCEEKICDLAFGCWLVKLLSIDKQNTNKMLCQLHSEWQVYGRNSTYNRYNPWLF